MVLEADPATKRLKVNATITGGGTSGTQYTDGDATITHPIGTIPVYDKSGTITAVSVSNPLPVSASVAPVADIFPATQNITAQDIATSTVAGFQGQSFIIGNPTANSAAIFSLSSITSINIQTTGIWTGSLRIEASTDGGTTYVSKFSRLPGTVYAGAATVTSNAFLIAAVSGCTHIRIRSIAAWTGTATIKISESINDHLVDVLNPIRLLDSTTSTLMTIKPASTAPVATDTAVIVALSPNTNLASGQPIINGEQTDFTGTFTNATQTGTVIATNLDGYGNVLISINGTYGTATAIFEGSDDSGTTWYTVQASRDNTNVIETGYTSLTNTSQTWQINNPGFDSIRLRSTAVTSGTVNVRMSASAAPGAAGANVAIGTALPTGTNVIGSVNQGTSPWVTSNATTSVVGNGAATTAQRVTLANDSTGIIATVGAVTAITNALPTGTNSIGKISDITTSVVPGVGATNLGKAEDAAHTSGDTGVFALAVRNDNLATTYGNDQDYAPIAVDLNSRVMVAQKAATATISRTATSGTTANILAANASRIGATISNEAATVLYVKFGTTASTTSYTVTLAGAASAPYSYYEVPAGYTGRIDAILASSTGQAQVTEIT